MYLYIYIYIDILDPKGLPPPHPPPPPPVVRPAWITPVPRSPRRPAPREGVGTVGVWG